MKQASALTTLRPSKAFHTAALYYDWTDRRRRKYRMTGKCFYGGFVYNFAYRLQAAGRGILRNGTVDLTTPRPERYGKLLQVCCQRACGHLGRVRHRPCQTGDIVCSIGSSRHILFSPTVTYADNTSEPVNLPYCPTRPLREEKDCPAAGSGMCVTRSTREGTFRRNFPQMVYKPREQPALCILHHFLPVTRKAFGEIMTRRWTVLRFKIKRCWQLQTMQRDYNSVAPLLKKLTKSRPLRETV